MQGVIKGVGYVSRTVYLKLLAQSYMIVLPYLWEEPFFMVALEAMAMGKPIIAYRAGGLRTLIHSSSPTEPLAVKITPQQKRV